MDHCFAPDVAHFVPEATGTQRADQSLSPRSTPLPMATDSLIHTVYIHNIPPDTHWKEVKGLLMNYIPDTSLLHIQIQIYAQSICAVVTMCDKASADIVYDELDGHIWSDYALQTSWRLESNDDTERPSDVPLTPLISGQTPLPTGANLPQNIRSTSFSSTTPTFYPASSQYPPPPPPLSAEYHLMEMYRPPPMTMHMAGPYGYPMGSRPPSSMGAQGMQAMQYSSIPPHMMGYYSPFPPPSPNTSPGGTPAFFIPQSQQQFMTMPRPPVPQLSHLPLPPQPGVSPGPQPNQMRSASFNAFNSPTMSSPAYRYSPGPPTVSARQLASLRQYPYQSIMDFNSPHSSRNSSISHSTGLGLQASSVDRRRLFVGNIPYDTTWMELKDYLREAGSIIRVEIPEQIGGVSRGFALATFEYEEDASRAIEMFDKQRFMGRELMVRYDKFPKRNGSSVSVSVVKFDEDEEDEDRKKTLSINDNEPESTKSTKSTIPRFIPKDMPKEDFDDKKFADEARSLVESLSLVDNS